ncbi:MAG TPA: protein kinase, partial [bacterium]|nr:protein kinase [bacterium]
MESGQGETASRQLIGADIGPYHIVEKLGEGGMGVVYKAVDRALDREVALKILFEVDEAANVKRFQQEARALAKLTHPNAIHIFWTGEFQGFPCFAMEYISEGVSVYDILRHKGVLPLEDSVDIVVQASKGLAAARRAGIVHRDIKPNNLLIDADGTVKISDFGLAKIVEDKDGSLTQSGIVMGTPYYMSPEQGQGDPIDHRSDLYSLGATFYHMITGFTPYEAQNPVSLIIKHVKDPIPDIRTVNPQIPDAIRRIVEKCLAKDPDERYQEYEELIEDLEAWQAGNPLVNASERRERAGRMPTWAPFVAGLGFAGLIAVGVKMMSAGSGVDSHPTATPAATTSIVAVRPSVAPSPTPVAPVTAEPGELARARADMTSADPAMRARAAATFGKLADRAALDDLLKLAADEKPHVRARAVWALSRIPDPRATTAEIGALRDEDKTVIATALTSVDGLKDVRVVEPLKAIEAKYAGTALARQAASEREKVFLEDPDKVFGDKPGTWWREQFRAESAKLEEAKTRVSAAERSVGYYRQRYGFTADEKDPPRDADVETKHVFR